MTVTNRIKASWHRGMSNEEAVKAVDEAIKSCIRDGILTEFLTKHRGEVLDVCLTEFDEKKYVEILLSDGYEKGREDEQRRLISMLLQEGKTPDQIHEFLHFPLDLIEKVRAEE